MGREDARQISVAKELRTLADAVDALKMATDRQADYPLQDAVGVARGVGAALVLLRERLLLLERVARGSSSPSQVVCRENEAHVAHGEQPNDLVISLWSAEELVQRWEHEWKVAKARLDRERQDPPIGARNEIVPRKPGRER